MSIGMPRVLIVGRTNVGKSTLFNRILGRRVAVVEDMPGVTRDIQAVPVEWKGTVFLIMDSGGYAPDILDPFASHVKRQIEKAIQQADVLILLTDVEVGIHEEDQYLARTLRRMAKPVIIAVNKVDSPRREWEVPVFHRLGINPVIAVSARNGRGVADLLDAVVENFAKVPSTLSDELFPRPRVAVVGRPNVGKSTLLNTLLGEQRLITSPIAGTTRDAIAVPFRRFGYEFTLIDTAGVRRRPRITSSIESFSVQRTRQAIRFADVVILIFDATEGVTTQDLRLLHQILEEGKGVVVAMNKKDLLPADIDYRHFEADVRLATAPFADYPLVFTSATKRKNLLKVLQALGRVQQNLHRQIPTAQFNRFIQPILKAHHPPSRLGKLIRIKYAMQVPQRTPPTFLFYANHPTLISPSYRRFLENKIRSAFDFSGVPLRIIFKEK